MSSIISGITKIFTSIGTGVATLGSAVRAVGASLFTASAATGGGLASATTGSGLGSLLGGGGVLSNVLGGAIKSGLSGALIGGLMGSFTGEGFGAGMRQGALSGAISGGVMGGIDTMFGGGAQTPASSTAPVVPANTPTASSPNLTLPGSRAAGVAAELASQPGYAGGAALQTTVPSPALTAPINSATQTPSEGGGFLKGIRNALGEQGFAAAIGGIGSALTMERQNEMLTEMAEKNRDFLRERDERTTASYRVDPSSLPYGRTATPFVDPTQRPKPGQRWNYNKDTGMIEYQ